MTKPTSAGYTADQVAEIVELIIQRLDRRKPENAPENLDNCTSQQPQPGTKITMSVSEAAKMIGISKPKMYDLIRSGEIPAVHAGTKILIHRQAIMDWLSKGDYHGEETC